MPLDYVDVWGEDVACTWVGVPTPPSVVDADVADLANEALMSGDVARAVLRDISPLQRAYKHMCDLGKVELAWRYNRVVPAQSLDQAVEQLRTVRPQAPPTVPKWSIRHVPVRTGKLAVSHALLEDSVLSLDIRQQIEREIARCVDETTERLLRYGYELTGDQAIQHVHDAPHDAALSALEPPKRVWPGWDRPVTDNPSLTYAGLKQAWDLLSKERPYDYAQKMQGEYMLERFWDHDHIEIHQADRTIMCRVYKPRFVECQAYQTPFGCAMPYRPDVQVTFEVDDVAARTIMRSGLQPLTMVLRDGHDTYSYSILVEQVVQPPMTLLGYPILQRGGDDYDSMVGLRHLVTARVVGPVQITVRNGVSFLGDHTSLIGRSRQGLEYQQVDRLAHRASELETWTTVQYESVPFDRDMQAEAVEGEKEEGEEEGDWDGDWDVDDEEGDDGTDDYDPRQWDGYTDDE